VQFIELEPVGQEAGYETDAVRFSDSCVRSIATGTITEGSRALRPRVWTRA
jgi:hypothetical protein